MNVFKQKTKRRLAIIVLMLVFVNIYGTLGFYLIEEGLELLDAFYLSAITYSTLGFGDIVPLTDSGKLFAVSTAVAGLLVSGISIGLFVQLLYEGTLQDILKGNKMEKTISKLEKHFIVCGRGSTGNQIVSELQERNYDVVVIDHEKECNEGLKYFLNGDARKDSVLMRAAIQNARGLAAVLKNDADNVFITLTARNLNPDIKIVSRFKDPDTEKKLKIAGADFVISPYKIGGHRMALSLASPILIDFLDETLNRNGLGVRFGSITLPTTSPVNGKKLRDSGIRENSLGAMIVAIIPPGEKPIFNPQASTVLQPLSQLLLLGTGEQMSNLRRYISRIT
ncbi:MAG: hypothetical protein CSA81_00235 [Acidobacteria bacterium]|nr:MAG: hypothetical protein CSA81_00235 [Acidobacteriota bacterium]